MAYSVKFLAYGEFHRRERESNGRIPRGIAGVRRVWCIWFVKLCEADLWDIALLKEMQN